VLQLPREDFLFHRVVAAYLRGPWVWAVTGVCVSTAAALVAPSFVELVKTGATYEHWSRFVAASVLVGVSLTMLVTRVLDFTLDLLEARLAFLRNEPEESAAVARDVA